jgi:hypothetical protein
LSQSFTPPSTRFARFIEDDRRLEARPLGRRAA